MLAAIGRVEERSTVATSPNVVPHDRHRMKRCRLLVEHASPLARSHRALKVALGADAPLRSGRAHRMHSRLRFAERQWSGPLHRLRGLTLRERALGTNLRNHSTVHVTNSAGSRL